MKCSGSLFSGCMAPNWAHEYFHSKREELGHLRFCQLCYEQQPEVEEVLEKLRSGTSIVRAYPGSVHNDSSPSSMINHLRAKHPEVVPDDTPKKRKSDHLGDVGSEKVQKTKCKDKTLTRDWVEHLIIANLEPVRKAESKHMRALLVPRLGPLPSRKDLDKEFEVVVQDIRDEVAARVAEALKSGSKFCISGDTWKNKGRKRRHYLACYLNFVTDNFDHITLCADVVEAPPPRTGLETKIFGFAEYSKIGNLLARARRISLRRSILKIVVSKTKERLPRYASIWQESGMESSLGR